MIGEVNARARNGPADHQARVGEREQRHDHVAGPGMEGLLHPPVRGDRLGQADAGRPGHLRRGLLAEPPHPGRGPLQVTAGGRVRRGQQADHHAGDGRVDAGLEERHPRGQAEPRVQHALPQAGRPGQVDHGQRAEPGQQRRDVDVAAVHDRDDHDRGEVVHHGEGQQVAAQPFGLPRADQGQHAERERGVGGHRRTPAGRRRAARVHREEDRHRHHQAAEPRGQRHRHPAPLAQLAHVELAARLQPDHQEEERHQAAVHPAVQVLGQPDAAQPQRHRRRATPTRTRRGGRSPRPAPRSWRRAGPRRCRSRSPGTGAGGSAGCAPRPSAQRRRQMRAESLLDSFQTERGGHPPPHRSGPAVASQGQACPGRPGGRASAP